MLSHEQPDDTPTRPRVADALAPTGERKVRRMDEHVSRPHFAAVPEAVALDPALSATDVRVYTILRLYDYGRGAGCFLPRADIAARAHVSESAAVRALRSLRKRGYITTDLSRDGRSANTHHCTPLADLPSIASSSGGVTSDTPSLPAEDNSTGAAPDTRITPDTPTGVTDDTPYVSDTPRTGVTGDTGVRDDREGVSSVTPPLYKDEVDNVSRQILASRPGSTRGGGIVVAGHREAPSPGPAPPPQGSPPIASSDEDDTQAKAARAITRLLLDAQGRPTKPGRRFEEVCAAVMAEIVVPYAGDKRGLSTAKMARFIGYELSKPHFATDHARISPRALAEDLGAWLDAGEPERIAELPRASPPPARTAPRRSSVPLPDPRDIDPDRFTSGKYGHLVES